MKGNINGPDHINGRAAIDVIRCNCPEHLTNDLVDTFTLCIYPFTSITSGAMFSFGNDICYILTCDKFCILGVENSNIGLAYRFQLCI